MAAGHQRSAAQRRFSGHRPKRSPILAQLREAAFQYFNQGRLGSDGDPWVGDRCRCLSCGVP